MIEFEAFLKLLCSFIHKDSNEEKKAQAESDVSISIKGLIRFKLLKGTGTQDITG
jgi:hypothetical protein